MSVVRRRLASQVAAARAVDFRTSLTWRGTVLSFALFALALAAADAKSARLEQSRILKFEHVAFLQYAA
jgi:hypothetical protein